MTSFFIAPPASISGIRAFINSERKRSRITAGRIASSTQNSVLKKFRIQGDAAADISYAVVTEFRL